MDVTPEIVQEFLDYNPETGILLWKPRKAKWFKSELSMRRDNAIRAGKRAGVVNTCRKSGYQSRIVKILGKKLGEHRAIWMWMTGEYPPDIIDHKNQDATDNRWSNISESSYTENNRNGTLRKNNTSGVTGVSWNRKAGKWKAYTKVDYKLHSLGVFDEIEDAEKAVVSFRKKNGFSEIHGKHEAHYKKK